MKKNISQEYNHPPYIWTPLSVTVEAAATTISGWTQAAPAAAGSLSTHWDAGTLTQLPFPDGLAALHVQQRHTHQ